LNLISVFEAKQQSKVQNALWEQCVLALGNAIYLIAINYATNALLG
jgi:hypothetical protein